MANPADTCFPHASIALYLYGLLFAQIVAGLPDPQSSTCPQLSYMLFTKLGIPSVRYRLPITPQCCCMVSTRTTEPSQSHYALGGQLLRLFWVPEIGRVYLSLLGQTPHAICLVAAILAYMVKRGSSHEPLSLFEDGSPLTKHRLVAIRIPAESLSSSSARLTSPPCVC